MSTTRALYLRVPLSDLERFRRQPFLLEKVDLRVPLDDGRALDLGRGWDEIGCVLEGGITAPKHGPMVGDYPLETGGDGDWSFIDADRVKQLALWLDSIDRRAFARMYETDDEQDTQDRLPDDQTGKIKKRSEHLFHKLTRLGEHYAHAAEANQAMLVRITRHVAK